MRKVIVSNMVTLDGFFAGPNGEIDWHVVNDEFFKEANRLLDSVDTLLFGRLTYAGMREYWLSPAGRTDDPVIGAKMNNTPKVVFSKTLTGVDWGEFNNATLVKGDIGAAVTKLKQQPGGDMVIFGSGMIVAALTDLGLIDDYRLFICPVVLGNGMPMFKGVTKPVNLKLMGTTTYNTGVVMHSYAPTEK